MWRWTSWIMAYTRFITSQTLCCIYSWNCKVKVLRSTCAVEKQQLTCLSWALNTYGQRTAVFWNAADKHHLFFNHDENVGFSKETACFPGVYWPLIDMLRPYGPSRSLWWGENLGAPWLWSDASEEIRFSLYGLCLGTRRSPVQGRLGPQKRP